MLGTKAQLDQLLTATIAAAVVGTKWYARHDSSRTAVLSIDSTYKWDQTDMK